MPDGMTMAFDSRTSLAADGFEGFITVAELQDDDVLLPETQGVYVVLYEGPLNPEFLPVGTGGHFKGCDPNVAIDILRKKWVSHCSTVYIGKAGGADNKSTLRRRVGDYLRFGQGRPVGHSGGRYIWQLRQSADLLVCWKATPEDEPREVEAAMLLDFHERHGCLPFANLSF